MIVFYLSLTVLHVTLTVLYLTLTVLYLRNLILRTQEARAPHLEQEQDDRPGLRPEREFFINLLVRIHFIIVMIRWTGLAPWEFELPVPDSLTSTFLVQVDVFYGIYPCLSFPDVPAKKTQGYLAHKKTLTPLGPVRFLRCEVPL